MSSDPIREALEFYALADKPECDAKQAAIRWQEDGYGERARKALAALDAEPPSSVPLPMEGGMPIFDPEDVPNSSDASPTADSEYLAGLLDEIADEDDRRNRGRTFTEESAAKVAVRTSAIREGARALRANRPAERSARCERTHKRLYPGCPYCQLDAAYDLIRSLATPNAELAELADGIAQEAHTMGRIYAANEDARKPAEEFDRVSKMASSKLRAYRPAEPSARVATIQRACDLDYGQAKRVQDWLRAYRPAPALSEEEASRIVYLASELSKGDCFRAVRCEAAEMLYSLSAKLQRSQDD